MALPKIVPSVSTHFYPRANVDYPCELREENTLKRSAPQGNGDRDVCCWRQSTPYISLMESGALAVFCDLISACKTLQWPWVSSRKEEPSICYGYVKHKISVFPLKGEQPSIRLSVRPSWPCQEVEPWVLLALRALAPAGSLWGLRPGVTHIWALHPSWRQPPSCGAAAWPVAAAAGAPEHPRSLPVAAAAWHR